MDVPDLLVNIAHRPKIPVVSSATLPESPRNFPVWLPVRHTLKERWGILFDEVNGSSRYRMFRLGKNRADHDSLGGENEHVNVFRHNYKSPEIKRVSGSGTIQRVDEPLRRIVTVEERLSLKT